MIAGIRVVSSSKELALCCGELAEEEFVCVDTEFVGERTYWPVLGLIQICGPSPAQVEPVLIDPIADGMDLGPFFRLMSASSVVKVFHSAEQDVEILSHYGGVIPDPMFDTQLAAAFCGYGAQASYASMVRRIVGLEIEKAWRITDWKQRPLSRKQMEYAIADVVHLPAIYARLVAELARRDRTAWVAEETAKVVSRARRARSPEQAWTKIRRRESNPTFLAVLRELASWREMEARRRDRPRRHLLSDGALTTIARAQPRTESELCGLRTLRSEQKSIRRDRSGIIAAVKRGMSCPPEKHPRVDKTGYSGNEQKGLASLLKVFLQSLAERQGIAESIVASSEELRRLAFEDEPDILLLKGWRRRIFGEQLLRLKRGEIALTVQGGHVVSVSPVEHK